MVAGARTFSLEETFLPAQILNPPPTRHALLAFLVALAALLHVGTAAWGDLHNGVEGQLAGAAREMAGSGRWLMPTDNGVPQLDTPPLACWSVALACKIFGANAAAARLPVALAMIGSVALVFLIGERLAGYWRGFSAGLIYLCTAGAFVVGRLVAPENIFSFFAVAAIYCLICGYQRQKLRRLWFAGFSICVALATLTLGPVALLFLGGIVLSLSIFFREARLRFAGLLHWTNLLLFLVIALPWFIWASKQFPELGVQFLRPVNSSPPSWRAPVAFLACWFPALFLILPGLVLAPRKILRPNESAFAEALPLCWIAIAILAEPFHGASFTVAGPGFALFAASAWERTSRPLRASGVALAFVVGVLFGFSVWRPEILEDLIDISFSAATWLALRPLAQIALGASFLAAVSACLFIKQRGEVMLVLALTAMVPVGFCLIESGSRAGPFFSLANAAQYLNPRLGRAGEVIFEGPPRSGSSLRFYLDKKFYLVNQKPSDLERDPALLNRYLDEHYLLEAWDRSDPLYLIIDESRVGHWRRLIVDRVHIYHQVTTCGRYVVLSNQL